jgi:hypothetical protein
MRFTVCASISPVIESLQVAALLVGSVACFAYMMAYEILKSVQHARRIHFAKTLVKIRRKSLADEVLPGDVLVDKSRLVGLGGGGEPVPSTRRKSLLGLAFVSEERLPQKVPQERGSAWSSVRTAELKDTPNPLPAPSGALVTRSSRVSRAASLHRDYVNPLYAPGASTRRILNE